MVPCLYASVPQCLCASVPLCPYITLPLCHIATLSPKKLSLLAAGPLCHCVTMITLWHYVNDALDSKLSMVVIPLIVICLVTSYYFGSATFYQTSYFLSLHSLVPLTSFGWGPSITLVWPINSLPTKMCPSEISHGTILHSLFFIYTTVQLTQLCLTRNHYRAIFFSGRQALSSQRCSR